MQRNGAQKLEARRAADATALENVKAALMQKLDDERAADAQAIEHLRADLARLTQLSTSAEQKRAEVAGEVLVAALRMLDALEGATSLGMFTNSSSAVEPSDRAARQHAATLEVEARAASVKPYDDDFRRAWHMAEVFLPEDVRDLLARINTFRHEILASQLTHAFSINDLSAGGHQFYRRGYGDDPKKKLGELRDQAKALLRPIAQLGRTG